MLSASQGGHFTGAFGENHQLAPEVALSNKFPGKLWRLVNSCKTGAIQWGSTGNTIIVHQTQFQREFLDPPNTMFKTTNIGSFIRQLNLYGFRKLNVVRFAEATPDMREIHEFQNDFFHRGRPDLLAYLKRNVGIRRTRDLAVKRRLESMDSGSLPKHARYYSQGLSYSPPFLRRHHTTVGSAGFPTTGLMYQSTATGKWPIYMHWDKSCGVCKYVVLPDTGSNTLPSSINGNPVVYSPVQGPDGRYYPVVKLPGKNQDDPPQEYYLVKILPEAFQQENFPKEIIPCYPAAPGEYNKILGGGDATWSYQSENAAVPEHGNNQDKKQAAHKYGCQTPINSRSQFSGDVPTPRGDGYRAAYPTSSDSKPQVAAGYQPHPNTTRRSYGNYTHHYDNDDDSDSEFSSTDSDDGDSTLCNHPSVGMFDGEPRVMCEGGRTVGLNELVQMAAKVLTQAQAQEVINTHAQAQQQQQQQHVKNSNAIGDVGQDGLNTPIMGPGVIKQEEMSPQAHSPKLQSLDVSNCGGPWTLVGGMTLMENSKVKVEMMETCNSLSSFHVPAALCSEASEMQ